MELMKNMLSINTEEIVHASSQSSGIRGPMTRGAEVPWAATAASLFLSRDPSSLRGKDPHGVDLSWADLGMADLRASTFNTPVCAPHDFPGPC